MSLHNPALHARSAADTLSKMILEVRAGRAEWSHPHLVRQGTEDLSRLAADLATALQQVAAAAATLSPTDRRTAQRLAALQQAGQSASQTAAHLTRAQRLR